jgi:hypothetical protein
MERILNSIIPDRDKLVAVLREEFIDAPILHEFACVCAEEAQKYAENPHDGMKFIQCKRKWLRGEISDDELKAVSNARYSIIEYRPAFESALYSCKMSAQEAAQQASWYAAQAVYHYTFKHSQKAKDRFEAEINEFAKHIAILKKLLITQNAK